MSETKNCYTTVGLDQELRQSEILSNVTHYTFDPVESVGVSRKLPLCIVMSQDCDLLRDFENRVSNKPPVLEGVLIYEVEPAEKGRSKNGINTGNWRSITANQTERFHYLQQGSAETDLEREGLPDLLIDFRRYVTISAVELERQISLAARRRCRLDMPYREHLQSRAGFYFQRVALPSPHAS